MFVALSTRSIFNRVLKRLTYKATRACNTISRKPALDFNAIKHTTKVPLKPTVSTEPIKTEKVKIDNDTIELLMRLSLVNLSDE